MKEAFKVIRLIVTGIAFLISVAGLILALLGVYEMASVFTHLGDDNHTMIQLIAIGLLRSVDLFLIATVFFVLSIGMLVLFTNEGEALPVKLPAWLHVKNFMELKVILWEAILTTLVVSFLVTMVTHKIKGEEITTFSLLVPAGILIIALSLFFLKKGEGH